MVGYRVTNEQFGKLKKLGEAYGMGPHDYARVITLKALPTEERKIFGHLTKLNKEDLKSNLVKKTHAYKAK